MSSIIVSCGAFIGLCLCGYAWVAYLMTQPVAEPSDSEFWTGRQE